MGSENSDKFIRFYKKTIELKSTEKGKEKLPYMIPYYEKNGMDSDDIERFELVLKGEKANKYSIENLFEPLKLNQILHDELFGKKMQRVNILIAFFDSVSLKQGMVKK